MATTKLPITSTYRAAFNPDEDPKNARNQAHTKEVTRRRVLVAYDDADRLATLARYKGHEAERNAEAGMHTPVDVRWYASRQGTGTVVECSIWIRRRGALSVSGYAKARGGGMCMMSVVFDAALESAGVKLYHSSSGALATVHGVGEAAVDYAMHAIACAAGFEKCQRTIV